MVGKRVGLWAPVGLVPKKHPQFGRRPEGLSSDRTDGGLRVLLAEGWGALDPRGSQLEVKVAVRY